MRGRIIPLTELSAAEQSSWAELAARAVDPNPLVEPGCVLAAAAHLPHGPSISLLVAEEAGRFYGATPIRSLRRRGSLPLPVVTTNVRRMTYLGTPLVDEDPEAASVALRSMLQALAEQRGPRHGACLVVEWLGDGVTAAALRQVISELGWPSFVAEDFDQPLLQRLDDPTGYTRAQSKRHLSDYRRRARRLAEHLGAELEVRNRAGDPGAVEEFIALEAAGYKAANGVAMATQPGEPAYFAELCRRFAAEGRLHHLCLEAAGHTIAMQLSLEAGDGLFLIKVSHDEALGRFDPGIQLHLRAMEYFHNETKAKWVAICTYPDNELLLRLYPDRRRTTTLVVSLGGLVDKMAVRALPLARGTRSALRGLQRRTLRSRGP